MNKELLEQAGINYDGGVAQCVGNIALFESLLLKFSIDDAPKRAEQYYNEKNYDKLFEVVHEVKGVSGNLCMKSLFSVASRFTEILRENDYTNSDFEELYSQFLSTIIATSKAIISASEG